jgi:hypothetical protein
MSTVPRAGQHAGPEEVTAELDAMQAVGHALSRLHDPSARARVLRWAVERFEMQFETTAGGNGGMTARVPTCSIDQSVTLDGVHELFDAPSAAVRSEILHLETIDPPPVHRNAVQQPNIRHQAAEPEPLDSLMRGLASDFQRFAVEWQGA